MGENEARSSRTRRRKIALLAAVPLFLALCVGAVILHDRWQAAVVAHGRGGFTNARLVHLMDRRPALLVISEVAGIGEVFEWRGYRLDLVDLQSGRRLARHVIERKRAGNITACAAASTGLIWCHGRGVGAELRDAQTLQVQQSAARITAQLPELGAALRSARTVSVDRDSGALVVEGGDQRRWSIDPVTLRAERFEPSVPSSPRVVGIAAAPTVRADSVQLQVGDLSFTSLPGSERRQITHQDGFVRQPHGLALSFLQPWFLADHLTRAPLRLPAAADDQGFIVAHVDGLEPRRARRLLTAVADGQKRWEADLGPVDIVFAARLEQVLLLALAARAAPKAADAIVALALDSGKELWRYSF